MYAVELNSIHVALKRTEDLLRRSVRHIRMLHNAVMFWDRQSGQHNLRASLTVHMHPERAISLTTTKEARYLHKRRGKRIFQAQ